MKFTDLFIHRPVLATVVSLLIVVLGLRSVFSLPINQYPRTQNAVVTVSTAYYGADAQTIAGFITQPLESAIAQAQGIDYLSSSSSSGVSTITATLRLNYDANRALTEINTQVASVRNQLPPQAQAARADGAGRADHRRDVHGVLQRHAADQQRHRLSWCASSSPSSIRSTACRPPRCSARASSRCAPGSMPAKMAAHRRNRGRCQRRADRQQLPDGAGRQQGPDGDGAADRRHRPAYGGGIQTAGRQAERRCHRASGGRGDA